MIYALVRQDTSHGERLSIAQAIQDSDSNGIQQHVVSGTIVHIMDVQDDDDLFCIHCCNPVLPSDRRPPRGRQAQQAWHFQHTEADLEICVGRVRRPPTPFALGLQNPCAHGCYILLGCEDVNDRDRTCCKTINKGHTYCHLAGQTRCFP